MKITVDIEINPEELTKLTDSFKEANASKYQSFTELLHTFIYNVSLGVKKDSKDKE